MGRTKGSGNRKFAKPPEEQHASLPAFKKLICYSYWHHTRREGKEGGWDPGKAGYKIHWSQSAGIQRNVAEKSFYATGKSMAELAALLAEKGHELKRPAQPFPPAEAAPRAARWLEWCQE